MHPCAFECTRMQSCASNTHPYAPKCLYTHPLRIKIFYIQHTCPQIQTNLNNVNNIKLNCGRQRQVGPNPTQYATLAKYICIVTTNCDMVRIRYYMDPFIAYSTLTPRYFLWHGTNPLAASKITDTDFDIKRAGTSYGALFGVGP